jgi:hypothetical protein
MMKRQHMPMLATALVVAIVGALVVGVPFSTVAFALLVLCCPLMMVFMHGGHGGHGAGAGPSGSAAKVHDEHRPAGRS